MIKHVQLSSSSLVHTIAGPGRAPKVLNLICERLSQTKIYPSKARKGLGRHIKKNDSEGRFCRGRKIRKRGYRNALRRFSTVLGKLDIPVRVAECCKCGARYSPLLSALKIGRYARRETNLERLLASPQVGRSNLLDLLPIQTGQR